MSVFSASSAGRAAEGESQAATEFDNFLVPTTPASESQSFFSNSQPQPEANTVQDPFNPVPVVLLQRFLNGKWYVLYDKEERHAFITWWNGTAARQELLQPGNCDPKFGNPQRKSEGWLAMHECAQRETGTPSVICKLCDTVLGHPAHKGGGTNGMTTHLKSKACGRYTGHKRGRESSVSEMVCT